MIKTDHDASGRCYRIILTANASMTPRQMRVVLGCVLLFLCTVGMGFLLLGAWPVLPFAGLEWWLLAWCMKKTLDSSRQQEVITLSDGVLTWEKGHSTPEVSQRFQCAWVALEWSTPDNRNHPRRLYLRSHGRKVETGSFLVEGEREALASELSRLLSDNQKLSP